MKVYEKKYKFWHPEDMKKIIDFLRTHGTLYVCDKIVESLYEKFSHDVYCAGWMTVDTDILIDFSEWLCQIDYDFSTGLN